MAAPFTDTPKIGADLNRVDTAADIAAGNVSGASHRLGSQVVASDGKRYVYAQANASLSAGLATCTVNAGTFLVTATAGSYKSPSTAMASGDRGWFGATSV